MQMSERSRWLALYVLCAGELMIVLSAVLLRARRDELLIQPKGV